ncbi:MAG: NAD(P)(+) transhydrogenase (Re/Si-specific) subunit beta [Pseudomonadota bacterium]
MDNIIIVIYVFAAACFILGIKYLSSVKTARKGNLISAIGMLVAVVATLFETSILTYEWIVIGIIIGSVLGFITARLVAMTAMPQMVAIMNGLGGLASLLVAWSQFYAVANPIGTLVAIFLSAAIGAVTFSGSFIAFLKLAESLKRTYVLPGQFIINLFIMLLAIAAGIFFIFSWFPNWDYSLFIIVMILALVLGVTTVMPIGGADMPVMIALLNSLSGLAAAFTGFVIMNSMLIVAGALVGASGVILTQIMCKGMNRSLANVMFGGMGTHKQKAFTEIKETIGETRPVSVEDAYYLLEAANQVVVVPGYGMAVAQAQHVVSELGDLLIQHNTQVAYAIHPVAGRMPGHMNVLLAEANVPYEYLITPEDINPKMEMVDVCLVIGANDVVNPAARDEPSTPIYKMPIIEVDRAKTVIVVKRSLAHGFANVVNPLFYKMNTRMLFGDAKTVLSQVVSEFKD